MNQGNYTLDEIKLEPTDFCIGAAGYPEKHFEAMNMATDLHYLKQKVDKGAEYIVTQLFYDNQKYFDFVKKCREVGIDRKSTRLNSSHVRISYAVFCLKKKKKKKKYIITMKTIMS